MPEIAEVKLTSEFINKHGRKDFVKIEKSPVSKVKCDLTLLNFSQFIVMSASRGKEMTLLFVDSSGPYQEKTTVLSTKLMKVTLGMSGAWIFYDPTDPKTEKLHKHVHLRLYTSKGLILGLYDTRRFAKWSWNDFDENRSPCPISETLKFQDNLVDNWKTHKDFTKQNLSEIMMSQRWFNGVGNYLRAEILYRFNKNPFQVASNLTESEVLDLAAITIGCCNTAYMLGGGQLKDWKNPDGEDPASFKEWMKCYGIMEKTVDGTGRAFWFDPKWKKA
jgi:endonuclease VIII-like 1